MKVNLARLMLTYVEGGNNIQEAADKALAYMSQRVDGERRNHSPRHPRTHWT
jgi:hypothetical protein